MSAVGISEVIFDSAVAQIREKERREREARVWAAAYGAAFANLFMNNAILHHVTKKAVEIADAAVAGLRTKEPK